MAEFERVFGGDIDPGAIGTTRFDIGEINAALAAAFPATASAEVGEAASVGGLPEPLGELVSASGPHPPGRELRRLLDAARLDEPVLVDAETVTRMVRPYPGYWITSVPKASS